MFTVGGSYARLFSNEALISRVVLEVDAFFLVGKKIDYLPTTISETNRRKKYVKVYIIKAA